MIAISSTFKFVKLIHAENLFKFPFTGYSIFFHKLALFCVQKINRGNNKIRYYYEFFRFFSDSIGTSRVNDNRSRIDARFGSRQASPEAPDPSKFEDSHWMEFFQSNRTAESKRNPRKMINNRCKEVEGAEALLLSPLLFGFLVSRSNRAVSVGKSLAELYSTVSLSPPFSFGSPRDESVLSRED